MTSHHWWGRILRLAGVTIAFVVFALCALINIQQRLLRWRANQLLRDVRAIQMGHSTWEDAQRLMNRWGAWGKWAGSCSSSSCDYQIALQDISQAYPTYFVNNGQVQMRSNSHTYSLWQRRLYSMLGGRVVQVYAGMQVRRGVIWTKHYDLLTSMYPRFPTAADEQSYMLIAESEGLTRFAIGHDWDEIRTHPDYLIESETPCSGCKFIRGQFTPFVTVSVEQSLQDFNTDCITRWHACDTPAQIMPSAWSMFKHESEKPDGKSISSPMNCEIPLEVLGRDYRFALLTEVTSIRTFHEPGFTRYMASLRSLESLKNEAHQNPKNMNNLRLGWTDTVLAGGSRPADVKQGNRIIFLFEAPLEQQFDVVDSGIGPCSFALDTPQSRAEVERGILRDGLADRP